MTWQLRSLPSNHNQGIDPTHRDNSETQWSYVTESGATVLSPVTMIIRISHHIQITSQYISIIKLKQQIKQRSKSGKLLITIVIFSLRRNHDRDSHLDRDPFLKGRPRSRFPSLPKPKVHLLTL